jgi:UDP-glucose-4-epimerase GalE
VKVLVTGGAGYIGAHTVRALLEAGHAPVVLDTLENGHAEAVPSEVLMVGDLADRAGLRALLDAHGFDAAIHFAGYIEARESAAHPGKYYRGNVALTVDLLECLVEAGVQRVVFSSSAGVYGKPSRVPIPEDEPAHPINPYAETKAMVERILADFRAAHGLRSIALRYFNAAGAHERGDLGEAHRSESHLIPRVLRVALGLEERITVFGTDHPTPNGTCIRDYVHVSDLARAHVLALDALESDPPAPIYNVGTGRGFSVRREVLETCRRVSGREIAWTDAPRFEGDPPALVADPSRLRADLGWRPRYADLESIVGSAWRWHSAHPLGFAT